MISLRNVSTIISVPKSRNRINFKKFSTGCTPGRPTQPEIGTHVYKQLQRITCFSKVQLDTKVSNFKSAFPRLEFKVYVFERL